jgi:hypothetical protein
MAFVLRRVAEITFTVEDKASTSSCSFHIGLGTLVGQAFGLDLRDTDFTTYLEEFASSLQNSTDCRVTGFTLTMKWVQDTLPAFGTDANVERKGVLQFLTADGFQSIFTIPGIKNNAVGGDGISLIRDVNTPGSFAGNPIETHLESVHDKMRNGVTINAVTYNATDRRGQDIRDLIDAYQQHRARSRG